MSETPRASLMSGSVVQASGREFAVFFLAYSLALLPVTIESISVNYSFLIVILLEVLVVKTLERPSLWLQYSMVLFFSIFAIATVLQYEFHPEAPRRLASFLLFMSMFAFTFVRITDTSIRAFKVAVVVMSLCLCLLSMYKFVSMGVVIAGEEEKNEIGSQRIGFLYLMAFWLIYTTNVGRFLSLAFLGRALGLAVVLVGLLLTFSRSSLVALVLSAIAYYLVEFARFAIKPSKAALSRIVERITSLVILSVLMYMTFPGIFDFFAERLGEWLLDPEVRDADLDDPSASGGTRAVIARTVIDFVLQYPLTGSGFLGIWIATKDFVGSAHNQYLDVLFRTGVLGFGLYVWIILRVSWNLYRRDQALFWGFLGCLLYGVFHETFKESHGAFLLAFLIGMLPKAGATVEKSASSGEGSSSISGPTSGDSKLNAHAGKSGS
jgi:O-antigen ligase